MDGLRPSCGWWGILAQYVASGLVVVPEAAEQTACGHSGCGTCGSELAAVASPDVLDAPTKPQSPSVSTPSTIAAIRERGALIVKADTERLCAWYVRVVGRTSGLPDSDRLRLGIGPLSRLGSGRAEVGWLLEGVGEERSSTPIRNNRYQPVRMGAPVGGCAGVCLSTPIRANRQAHPYAQTSAHG